MSLIVYRGAEIPLGRVHAAARELLGGHLLPDAAVIAHGSAPVRVDRDARDPRNPLAGTVRAIHLAVPYDDPAVLSDLSRMLLKPKQGLPAGEADVGWQRLEHGVLAAVAMALSEDAGPLAVLTLEEDARWRGSYSLFSRGRRLWSSCFEAGVHCTTWDGETLRSEAHAPDAPLPVEGSPSDFPVHGLQLLYGAPLRLTPDERLAVVPSLWRASRPPSEGSSGMVLVRDGRFVERGETPDPETWLRLTASLEN
jgi:hypothetical protein